MTVNKKHYYQAQPRKFNISKFYGQSKSLDKKLDILQSDFDLGFNIYNSRQMKRFVDNHKDFHDFAVGFILIKKYYDETNNSKFGSTKNSLILLHGVTHGTLLYNEKIERVAGKNNPWFNHKGKYSPFKEGSINYSKDSIIKAGDNRSYNTTLSYYLNKGFSEEESKKLLKERQTTFSLNKCIKKHGEIKGTIIWQERQEKWQKTLNNKTQTKRDEYNLRKSSGSGNMNKSKQCFLYYIRFFDDKNEFWKIGITTQTVDKRFKTDTLLERTGLRYEILFNNLCLTVDEAFEQEQFILSTYNSNRININFNGFKTTEAFNENVLMDFL